MDLRWICDGFAVDLKLIRKSSTHVGQRSVCWWVYLPSEASDRPPRPEGAVRQGPRQGRQG
eukprot:4096631-Pyramimonas_sp.AAC.1